MRVVVFTTAIVLASIAGPPSARAQSCADLTALRAQLEAICPCAGAARKKAYLKCVKTATKVGQTQIPDLSTPCRKALVKMAKKQSVCGRSGAVVCCRSPKASVIAPNAAKCTGKLKGTACETIPNPPFSVFPAATADCVAGACPTTSTTSSSTSTSSSSTTSTSTTSSTTTSTTPTLCAPDVNTPPGEIPLPNGTLDAGEDCDDGNLVTDDGCTNECTCCGPPDDPKGENPDCLAPTHPTVTEPETCEDGNLVSGDGCDGNCRVTGCGNLIITGMETCDDGNTSDDDACPSDCIVDACTPDTATELTVSVNFASIGGDVGGLTVLVDYPEGKVSIPGFGAPPAGVIDDFPLDTFNGQNDLEHAVRVLVFNTLMFPIDPGLLFRINFDRCQGAAAPVAGEFACTVLSATDPSGATAVPGVTCSVTIP
jgi:cysteine-rich repeat protein